MHFTLGQGALDKLIQDSDTNLQLLDTVHPAANIFVDSAKSQEIAQVFS
jgi:hypothetical protein